MDNLEKLTREQLLTLLAINGISSVHDKPVTVRTPADLLLAVAKYKKKKQEYFITVTLNGNHDIIKVHEITKGTLNRSLVHPREIYRMAIKENAAAIVCVHNHPSGSLIPSSEDNDVTKRLTDAGNIIGIPMLDHIIISVNGYYSYLEQGSI